MIGRVGTDSSPPSTPAPARVTQSRQSISARSYEFVRDVSPWCDKTERFVIPSHLVLSETRRTDLQRVFGLSCSFVCTPIPLVVDPTVDIKGISIQDGMGDNINVKEAVRRTGNERPFVNISAKINENRGYFSQPGVSLHPAPKIPLRTGTFPPLVADAVTRIAAHMKPFQIEREKQAGAWVAHHRAMQAKRPVDAFIAELERSYHKASATKSVTKMLPRFAQRCLRTMDKKLKGRGYRNTHASWTQNGGMEKNGKKISGKEMSRRTQEHHALLIVRQLLLSGAARGIPGLAFLCAWLELAFENEQVESVDPHFQGILPSSTLTAPASFFSRH
jgi:hypothetical protein